MHGRMDSKVLGWAGVAVALGLLGVSLMMNWRFGYSLGRTEFDGYVYAFASACADTFKALIPFFFFAAYKNKLFGQAVAAAVIWTVVTAYSMTSAVGHSALNRTETAAQRVASADSYKDLRDAKARIERELESWTAAVNRPADAIKKEIDGARFGKMWTTTNGCTTEVVTSDRRDFCKNISRLEADLGTAMKREEYALKLEEVSRKLGKITGAEKKEALSEADPQASALVRIAHAVGFAWVSLPETQTGLSLFVALLIELGSNLGLYLSFGYLRKDHRSIIDLKPDMVTPLAAPAALAEKTALSLAVASAPLALPSRAGGNVHPLPQTAAPGQPAGDRGQVASPLGGKEGAIAATFVAPRNPFLSNKPAPGSEGELRSIRFPLDGRTPSTARPKLPLKDAAENFVRGLQAWGFAGKEIWTDEPHPEAISKLWIGQLYQQWSEAYHTEMVPLEHLRATLKKTKGIEHKDRVRIDPDKRDETKRRNCFIVAGRRYPKAEEAPPAPDKAAPPEVGGEVVRPPVGAADDVAPTAMKPRLAIVPTRSFQPDGERWEIATARSLKGQMRGFSRKQRGSRMHKMARAA